MESLIAESFIAWLHIAQFYVVWLYEQNWRILKKYANTFSQKKEFILHAKLGGHVFKKEDKWCKKF